MNSAYTALKLRYCDVKVRVTIPRVLCICRLATVSQTAVKDGERVLADYGESQNVYM